MKNRVFVFVLAMILLLNFNLHSETITGKVTLADEGDKPIAVNLYYTLSSIYYNGTAVIDTVDDDGNFSLEVPDGINYAAIHCNSEGYQSFITGYIKGDKNPKFEAVLYKRPVPEKIDSIRCLAIARNVWHYGTMKKISEDNYEIEYKNIKQDSVYFSVSFDNEFYFYADGIDAPARYDNNGDYFHVIPRTDSTYKFSINPKNFRQVPDVEKAELTNGKWIDSPINSMFHDIITEMPYNEFSDLNINYYYYVEQIDTNAIKDLSMERRDELKNNTLNKIYGGFEIIDKYLEESESPFIHDYLLSQKTNLLFILDSIDYDETLKNIESLTEMPNFFLDTYLRIFYSEDSKNNYDELLELFENAIENTGLKRYRELMEFDFVSFLSRNEITDELKYADYVIKRTKSLKEKATEFDYDDIVYDRIINKIEIKKMITPPDFTFKNISDNKEYKLSDFKGKWILLDFWGTWCAPCRAETPYLVNTFNKLKDNDKFVMISVASDQSPEVVKKYMEKFKMEWLNTIEFQGYCEGIMKSYGISSFPTLFLIKPDGTFDKEIKKGTLRGENLLEILNEKLVSN